MATKEDGKTFKQDMVVPLRYRNELPPPPMPPKLLDIDSGDLSQYTEAGYGTKLARKEMPNIDFDAEGGMTIDMVGMPGYFLGDESSIMAPDVAPVLDPEDAALMVTPEQLRSGGARTDGHSFLRKTQYMSSSNSRTNTEPLLTKSRARKPQESKNTAPMARDDPDNIKRHLQKGFDLAYPDSIPYNPPQAKAAPITPAERDAWQMPVHPDNPKLKPVAFYPIIPDLESGTDVGEFTVIKLDKAPLPERRDRRDDRIDLGLFTAFGDEAAKKAWRPRQEAFLKDPDRYEDPGPEPSRYALYVPTSADSVARMRRMMDDSDPQKDNPDWVNEICEPDEQGMMRFPFDRVKIYPNMKNVKFETEKHMALALHDPKGRTSQSRFSKQGRAAYYYPVTERKSFRSDHSKANRAAARRENTGEDLNDDVPSQLLALTIEESLEQRFVRASFRGQYESSFEDEWKQMGVDADPEQTGKQAEIIEQEQGTLHQGAQDTSMAEVEAANEMHMADNGLGPRADRDDDDEMTD